jgi:hypothetical protein
MDIYSFQTVPPTNARQSTRLPQSSLGGKMGYEILVLLLELPRASDYDSMSTAANNALQSSTRLLWTQIQP